MKWALIIFLLNAEGGGVLDVERLGVYSTEDRCYEGVEALRKVVALAIADWHRATCIPVEE